MQNWIVALQAWKNCYINFFLLAYWSFHSEMRHFLNYFVLAFPMRNTLFDLDQKLNVNIASVVTSDWAFSAYRCACSSFVFFEFRSMFIATILSLSSLNLIEMIIYLCMWCINICILTMFWIFEKEACSHLCCRLLFI